MANPFAKKAEEANAEPAMEGHGLNFMAAMLDALQTVLLRTHQQRREAARMQPICGGHWTGSIKQVTRLNKMHRNQARRERIRFAMSTRGL